MIALKSPSTSRPPITPLPLNLPRQKTGGPLSSRPGSATANIIGIV